MMRITTLEEIYARMSKHDHPDVKWLFAKQDELLILENENGLGAIVAVHLNGDDVRCGNMWLSGSCAEETLDAFICYAKEHYAGKLLHVSANRDESMAYEVLRYHDFVVDEIVTELNDDEEEYECIVCSKQL